MVHPDPVGKKKTPSLNSSKGGFAYQILFGRFYGPLGNGFLEDHITIRYSRSQPSLGEGGGGGASEAIGNCHHRSSMNMVPALYDSTAHNARRM